MANTPIEFTAYADASGITADLISLSDTIIISGASGIEETNAKGQFRITHSGVDTGVHFILINDDGDPIGRQWVDIEADDTNVYRAVDNYGTLQIKDVTDQITFTIANQVDATVVSEVGGYGTDQVTINVEDDGSPVSGVSVWISTDEDGDTVVAGTALTDTNGEVKFLLFDGLTYYLWAQKYGKMSISGQEFIADAD